MKLHHVTDRSAWHWLTEHTRGSWASAGSVLPSGYEATTRILHPVDGRRWADVAAERDTVVHPLVQWESLLCNDEPHHPEIPAPVEGTAPRALVETLLAHLPTTSEVYRAVWEGFGWWAEPRWDGPMLELPGRRHVVFSGPPGDIRQWPGWTEPGDPQQSASLMWAADRSWVLATDVDWPFTLLASSASVAAAVRADPHLEAFPITLDDDLSWFGDRVNPQPRWLEALA